MADDCTTRLAEARQALHDMNTGQAVVSVSVEGETVNYSEANRAALENYVARLEGECGDTATNVTPTRRGPGRLLF